MRIIAHTLHVRAEDRRVDGTHWDGLADVVLHGIHDATTDDQTVAANCQGTKRLNGYWWGQEPQPPVLHRLGSKIEQLWYRLHSTGVDTQVPR